MNACEYANTCMCQVQQSGLMKGTCAKEMSQGARLKISNLGGDWGSLMYPKGKVGRTSRIPKEKGSVRSVAS